MSNEKNDRATALRRLARRKAELVDGYSEWKLRKAEQDNPDRQNVVELDPEFKELVDEVLALARRISGEKVLAGGVILRMAAEQSLLELKAEFEELVRQQKATRRGSGE